MADDVTLNEQKNVRTALRYLHRRAGTWAMVAASLHYAPRTLVKVACGQLPVTPSLVFRVARFLGSSVGELLEGRFLPGACSRCGNTSDFTDDDDTFIEHESCRSAAVTLVE